MGHKIVPMKACIASRERTKSDKYAASGAEMEKLINMESQLLFQIERKISELPKQTNPLTKIQFESLINAIAKLEDERKLSKVEFQSIQKLHRYR